MRECHKEKNLKFCNCTYEPCPRKGICCDCMTYHRKMGQLPACYFPADVESSYDRSIECFVRTFQSRGRWW